MAEDKKTIEFITLMKQMNRTEQFALLGMIHNVSLLNEGRKERQRFNRRRSVPKLPLAPTFEEIP